MNIVTKIVRVVVLAALVLGFSAGAAAAGRYYQDAGPLFIDANPPANSLASRAPDTGRQRFVKINLASLEAATPGRTLDLNLFSDLQLQADIKDIQHLDGQTVWVGDIEGVEMGQVFVVASQDQVALDISMPQGIYQVRYAGDGVHRIEQIDQSAYPEEMPPVEINLPPAAANSENPASETPSQSQSPLSDDGSVIDVFVAYTPSARSGEGGVTGMQNLIALAVAEANQSYANSGIRQRLNLVGTTELAYTESGDMSTDLARLQTAGDGYMDTIQTLRNSSGADLVDLLVTSKQYCGIAYHMSTVSPSFESYAYSVVASDCATGYYSFAHELGHNMGARHDWYVDNLTTPATYAHGYVYVPGRWRTIMAYNNECTIRGADCTRLQYWSNPGLNYGTVPMGVAGGTNTACAAGDKNHPPCDADDHRTLNDTALTVANFRVRNTTPPTRTPTPTVPPTAGPPPTATPIPTSTPVPTPVISAHFPMADGFESGALDRNAGWGTYTTAQGRVRISQDQPAYAGSYSLLLDDSTNDGTNSIAAAILTANLAGRSDARLEFYWRSFTDENHPEDGVFISDNYGATWVKVITFNNGTSSYQRAALNLGGYAQGHGMKLNDHFQIKFQFYDNYSIPEDGYGIDEVKIGEPEPFWQAAHYFMFPLIRK